MFGKKESLTEKDLKRRAENDPSFHKGETIEYKDEYIAIVNGEGKDGMIYLAISDLTKEGYELKTVTVSGETGNYIRHFFQKTD